VSWAGKGMQTGVSGGGQQAPGRHRRSQGRGISSRCQGQSGRSTARPGLGLVYRSTCNFPGRSTVLELRSRRSVGAWSTCLRSRSWPPSRWSASADTPAAIRGRLPSRSRVAGRASGWPGAPARAGGSWCCGTRSSTGSFSGAATTCLTALAVTSSGRSRATASNGEQQSHLSSTRTRIRIADTSTAHCASRLRVNHRLRVSARTQPSSLTAHDGTDSVR
jgi:hypothetical protein